MPSPHDLRKVRAKRGHLAPFPERRFRRFLRACRVQTKEYGLQRLDLGGTQEYVLLEIIKGLAEGASTFVILKARQIGISTLFLALDLFWAFEYAGMAGAFATHEDASAVKFRAAIDTFLAYLPTRYKVNIRAHNRSVLILQNGSMFAYMVAGTKSSKGRAAGLGRSGAVTYIHATEVAFWGNENDINELKATAAQHNPNRLQIWESTAHGFNHYEDMWQTAKTSPTQRAIFVGWWRWELYRIEREDPRFLMYCPDNSLREHERERMRAVKAEYGVDVSMEQIAWHRWCLEDEQKGDESMMAEKYPWTEDDAFQATGSKFFNAKGLTAAMRAARKSPMRPFRYVLGDEWLQTKLEPLRDHKRAELKIYEDMHPDGIYVMGVDPAYGSSDENDSTAMSIFRCYADCLVQVAEYASTRTTTYECAWIMAHLAGYYRRIRVNLEITGPGTAVHQELQQLARQVRTSRAKLETGGQLADVLNHMGAFLYKRPDSLGGDFVLHTKTTSEIKEAMCNSYRDSFQTGRLLLRSIYLCEEMKTITREDNWVGGANRRADDRFMAAVLAHQTWKTWEQPKLYARGYTRAAATSESTKPPGQRKAEQMVINYLRTAQIAVPQ